MSALVRKLRGLLSRGRLQQDLAAEIRTHIEHRARQLEDRGMPAEEARRVARQQFGSPLAWSEESHWTWGFRRLEGWLQDIRYGARSLRRNPLFSLTAIAIIAVGIGAGSAIFSVVDRLLFRSLPYPDDERLVSVGVEHPMFLNGEFLVATDFFRLREQTAIFEAVTSMRGIADCDLTEDRPLRMTCASVESTFLPVFGIAPAIGRNFTMAEDRPNVPKVALISHAIWQSRFAGDAAVLGRRIPVDGDPFEIVGVLPRDFEMPGLQRVDLLVPQAVPTTSGTPLRVFGRLKPGITVRSASAPLRPFFEKATEFMPQRMKAQAVFRFRSVRDYQTQDVKLSSWVLVAATLAILLIVCANVANLLLARLSARQREIAVRAALGAGRSRLLRLLFAESLLLSSAGAAAGCGFAWILLRGVKLIAPAGIPRLQQAALDTRVLLFTVLLTVACGVVLTLVPAGSSPWAAGLAGRGTASTRTGLRRVLTAAQVAVSLILICDAGLLLQSLQRMQSAVSRLDSSQVVTANIVAGPRRYPTAITRQQFFDTLAGRLRQYSQVSAVALSDTMPPSGYVHSRPLRGLVVPGEPIPEDNGRIVAWRQVTPDYFRTLGIALHGRSFREDERTSAERTIILSGSLARTLFHSQDPLGRMVSGVRGAGAYTVIGVAADVDNNSIPGRADPEYYLLWKKVTDPQAGANVSMAARVLNQYDGDGWVTVRSIAPADTVAAWIRAETAALDPTVPVTLGTLQQRLHGASARPRFSALLLALFAAIGVVLAASGLYGLISFLVVRRTSEIGVRMALGATPRQIVMLVVQESVRWTAAGIALGLAGAVASLRVLRGILFEAPSQQGPLFALSAGVLLVVALGASLVPSLRAARVDPVQALRRE